MAKEDNPKSQANQSDDNFLGDRRLMTVIEQSCKLAARAFIFQPNNQKTWNAIKTMIESFLHSIWEEGALMGETSEQAYRVRVGDASVMSAEDVNKGQVMVIIDIAPHYPAEFIVLTFLQQQAEES